MAKYLLYANFEWTEQVTHKTVSSKVIRDRRLTCQISAENLAEAQEQAKQRIEKWRGDLTKPCNLKYLKVTKPKLIVRYLAQIVPFRCRT